MFDSSELSTRSYLLKEKELNPNDERLQIYDAIQKAVSNITPWGMLTITTTTPIYDLTVFEGLVRRFYHQVHRSVLGMRKRSRVPMLTILERNKKGVLHAHILIGHIQGSKREQEVTTFKHFLQKQIFPSVVRVLRRLTYGIGKQNDLRLDDETFVSTKLHEKHSKQERIILLELTEQPRLKVKAGKIGMHNIKSVYDPVRLVDYLLKGMRLNNLYVAWLASDLGFCGSVGSRRPDRPNHPESKMVQRHTQSKAPLKVP
jgi:hypothetical protein